MARTVVIFAAGSRGDVQPCLALGRALSRQGDAVRLLASARYQQLITAAGLQFHSLPADPTEIIESPEGQELLAGRRNPAAFIRGINRIVRPLFSRLLAETQAGAQGADLVLAPTFGFLGIHLSQYLRVPHAIIHFQPSQPTGVFPHPFTPTARFLGSLGNRLSFEAVNLGSWLVSRPFINAWRMESLGLPALSPLGPLHRVRHAPVLCAFSPTVVPRPTDWGPNVHMTGFWHHEQPLWKPPRRLLDFLDDGPPPVYVGFGSMRTCDPEATDRVVRAALRRAGLRGVLAGDPATSDDDMLVVGDTPHSWLFPRMAAVVHHGGAGTTASALSSGVPSLVCPFFGDQPYWADRVHSLGVGPKPLPSRQLTVPALAGRLRAVTRDSGHAEEARRLGRALTAEDGVGRACRILNRLVG
ncbi:UDP:flavonoid glycosyltransferase YjiC (YdhE family) [Streptomyces umbrinus]|uniref:UDP:flavonoid glycosyltransferase YjiC (YdhE family) n=1 Tax=Streptomyces umbrinus TaxID=67370 RepID=A0ABU0SKV0_9ACTN|nr:glycosyltransferase [Streptomyces umbrinus]MDQ1024183.1 UDP:flavonoid glycosyltransferase YjiC (YdhE family) [Streptomyces umbrinus]